ncbi:MAG: acylphosphatase [Clostridia bacterium]|nr:acylphosphatase [Clostridia bacterium]
MGYHFKVTGRVQGVGFRYFVKVNAERLHLTGWVRNLSDGAVEGIICGNKEALSQMLSRIEKGNNFSQVINMEIEEIEDLNLTTFRVLASE